MHVAARRLAHLTAEPPEQLITVPPGLRVEQYPAYFTNLPNFNADTFRTIAKSGVLPDGTNLRTAPYNIDDAHNGINRVIRATHRQNFLIPPRSRRSFPLVELLDGIPRQFLPIIKA